MRGMHEATDFEHMKSTLGKKKENYSQDPRNNRGDIMVSWYVEINTLQLGWEVGWGNGTQTSGVRIKMCHFTCKWDY